MVNCCSHGCSEDASHGQRIPTLAKAPCGCAAPSPAQNRAQRTGLSSRRRALFESAVDEMVRTATKAACSGVGLLAVYWWVHR
jgi:hypothetical protein